MAILAKDTRDAVVSLVEYADGGNGNRDDIRQHIVMRNKDMAAIILRLHTADGSIAKL